MANLYNNVDCYNQYLGFIQRAVDLAKDNPNEVTLYITNAPYIDLIVYEAIVRKIRRAPFRKVITLFRSAFYMGKMRTELIRRPDTRGKKIVRKYLRRVGGRNARHELWMCGGPHGFHTKWAAIEIKAANIVEVLLSSAVLIHAHMPDRPRSGNQAPNINFLRVIKMNTVDFHDRFTSVMRNRCSGLRLYHLASSFQFVQTDIEKKYCADHARAGHAHQNNFVGVGNYTDVQLYAATRNFLQENIMNRKTMWIISPFIKNDENDTQCSTLIALMLDLQLGPDPNITVVHKNGDADLTRLPNLRFVEQQPNFAHHCKLMVAVNEANENVKIFWTSGNFNRQSMNRVPRPRMRNINWVADVEIADMDSWQRIRHKLGLAYLNI